MMTFRLVPQMTALYLRVPFFAVLLLICVPLTGQLPSSPSAVKAQLTSPQNRRMLLQLVQSMEVKALPKPPAWLPAGKEPLFTVAWLSDLHIGASPGALERSRAALNLLRDTLKPDITFLTGDVNAQADGLGAEYAAMPLSERRHHWLRRFLAAELSRPYTVVPGDNWAWDSEKVFGPATLSYDCCGFHFVFTATDAQAPGNEACAVFADDTKAWLERDLAANAHKPTLFVMHETAFPPVFLDATWVEKTLKAHGNVVAALSGHIHLDLEFKRPSWKQLICPAIGPSSRPAFKWLEFHRSQVVIRTYEFADGAFSPVEKYQRIVIPKSLRSAVVASGKQAGITNRAAMPARPKKARPELAGRFGEIEQELMKAATRFLMSR